MGPNIAAAKGMPINPVFPIAARSASFFARDHWKPSIRPTSKLRETANMLKKMEAKKTMSTCRKTSSVISELKTPFKIMKGRQC